jgi:hypothetical protein
MNTVTKSDGGSIELDLGITALGAELKAYV